MTSSTASPAPPRPFAFPGERPVTPEVVREHNLNDLEYGRIVEMLGRDPDAHRAGRLLGALVGALLVQALEAGAQDLSHHRRRRWSRARARTPACSGCRTGWAVAFKIESHNHPSAVEPYQGAATGVGGILRDVFTMGARPVAVLNSLRFGPLDHPRNRYLFAGVVRGVGDYGNCVGVPDARRRGRLRRRATPAIRWSTPCAWACSRRPT